MTDYPPEDNRLPEIVSKIKPAFGQYLGYGKGWDGIVANLDMLLEKIHPGITYLQIKEKFGRLRVYIDTTGWVADDTNRAEQVIAEAEAASGVICEVCGAPAQTRVVHGWWHTLCEPCDKKREERRAAFQRGLN